MRSSCRHRSPGTPGWGPGPIPPGGRPSTKSNKIAKGELLARRWLRCGRRLHRGGPIRGPEALTTLARDVRNEARESSTFSNTVRPGWASCRGGGVGPIPLGGHPLERRSDSVYEALNRPIFTSVVFPQSTAHLLLRRLAGSISGREQDRRRKNRRGKRKAPCSPLSATQAASPS